jgi:hypothetical protein
MGMMIVRHKVRDYGQWRPIFDQHGEMQRRRVPAWLKISITFTAISESRRYNSKLLPL